jgi:hypothetical protein
MPGGRSSQFAARGSECSPCLIIIDGDQLEDPIRPDNRSENGVAAGPTPATTRPRRP